MLESQPATWEEWVCEEVRAQLLASFKEDNAV